MLKSELWHEEKGKVCWFLIKPNLNKSNWIPIGGNIARQKVLCNMMIVKVMNIIKRSL